ncbi:hypothetical protein [Demequina sp.]|uniref:hypothetical protein n=1 Tax=Demequina sp. TaxID=2050685 RepID=UPI0025BCAACD|nr:hypothetical protein [Demequina sp.]
MGVRHLLFASLVMPLVACGASPDAAEGSSTATPTAVTLLPDVPADPTPTSTSTAGTAAATPASDEWGFGDEWDYTGADGAQGSGCAPGSATLPDGVWFGLADSWSTSNISVDLACWYSGATAESVAAARGDEVNNDYYLVNDVSTLRSVPVDGNVPAKKAGWDDGVFTLSEVMADPGGSLPTNHPYPVWVYVNGGVVTAVAVQYIP